MNRWLLKTEPDTYAWSDLVREGRTAWTGVTNPQAQANLRAMREGDLAVVYHSGEKRAVGLAEVVRAAYPEAGQDRRVCVDVRPVRALPSPVGLEALKGAKAFAASPLLRQGRLSVVPLDRAQLAALERLAASSPGTGAPRRAAPRPARPGPRSRPRGRGPSASAPRRPA